MTVNASTLANDLYPGIKKHFDMTIDQWQPEYPRIFDMESSDRADEEYQEQIGMGQIPEVADGAPTTYEDVAQGHSSRIKNKAYKLGISVTKEAVDDNQYRTINKLPMVLAQSVIDTIENLGGNVLNRADNTAFTGADGQPLGSALHTHGNGVTYSNVPDVNGDLAMTTYEQMTIDLASMTDGAGKKQKMTPQVLIVSPKFKREAEEILGSDLDPETANNAINVYKNSISLVVSHYLTDDSNWFVRTNQQGLICQKRIFPATVTKDNDFSTDNARFKTYFRLVFSWYNSKSIYCNFGA